MEDKKNGWELLDSEPVIDLSLFKIRPEGRRAVTKRVMVGRL